MLVVLGVLMSACSDDGAAPPTTTAAPGPDLSGQLLIVGRPIEPISDGEQQLDLALVPMSDPDSVGVDLGVGTSAHPISVEDDLPWNEGSSVIGPAELSDPLVLEISHGDVEASTCVQVSLTAQPARAEPIECPHGDPRRVAGRWSEGEARGELVDLETGERSVPDDPSALQSIADVHPSSGSIALRVRHDDGHQLLDLVTRDGRRMVLDPPPFWSLSTVVFEPTGSALLVTTTHPGGGFVRMVRIPVDGGPEEVLLERASASWAMSGRPEDNLVVFQQSETDGKLHVLRADGASGPLREVAVLPHGGIVTDVGRRPGTDDLWLIAADPVATGSGGLYGLSAAGDLRLVATGMVTQHGVVVSDDGELVVGVQSVASGPGSGDERDLSLVASRGGELQELVSAPLLWILDLAPDGSAVVYASADGYLGTGKAVESGLWRLDLTTPDASPQQLDDRYVLGLVGGRGFQEWVNPHDFFMGA